MDRPAPYIGYAQSTEDISNLWRHHVIKRLKWLFRLYVDIAKSYQVKSVNDTT